MPAFYYQSPPRPPRLVERRDIATWLMVFALAGLLGLVLLWPACARANEGDIPGTLGCFDTAARQYCGRVIVPAGLGGLNLRTRGVELGAFPTGGMGLALDLWAREWYTVSPGVAIAASAASATANYANIATLVGVAKFAWVGAMVHIDASLTEWKLLAGVDPVAIASSIGSSKQEEVQR